jgi:DNA-binding IclR family transcriptional regulator
MSELGKFSINEAQQRLIRIITTLAGHELNGLTQQSIALSIKANDDRVHHDLRNLAHSGLAERLETGRWRLGPKLIQIGLDYHAGQLRIQRQAQDLRERYTK